MFLFVLWTWWCLCGKAAVFLLPDGTTTQTHSTIITWSGHVYRKSHHSRTAWRSFIQFVRCDVVAKAITRTFAFVSSREAIRKRKQKTIISYPVWITSQIFHETSMSRRYLPTEHLFNYLWSLFAFQWHSSDRIGRSFSRPHDLLDTSIKRSEWEWVNESTEKLFSHSVESESERREEKRRGGRLLSSLLSDRS